MQRWNLEWKLERGVEKAWVLREENGKQYHYLRGYASDTSLDRDGDRMSAKALKSMKGAIDNGMNLFSNHEHGWKDTLGVISKAEERGNGLYMEVRLEDPMKNKDVDLLLHKLDIGEKLGLSIGGDMVGSHTEDNMGKSTRVIEDVKLYEVSLVGLPSNPNAYVTGTMYKSYGSIFRQIKNIASNLLKEMQEMSMDQDDIANAVYPFAAPEQQAAGPDVPVTPQSPQAGQAGQSGTPPAPAQGAPQQGKSNTAQSLMDEVGFTTPESSPGHTPLAVAQDEGYLGAVSNTNPGATPNPMKVDRPYSGRVGGPQGYHEEDDEEEIKRAKALLTLLKGK